LHLSWDQTSYPYFHLLPCTPTEDLDQASINRNILFTNPLWEFFDGFGFFTPSHCRGRGRRDRQQAQYQASWTSRFSTLSVIWNNRLTCL
jgi:hypothetical protein